MRTMYVMYLFFLLLTMCAPGLCSNDTSALMECLEPCSANETCISFCTSLISDIDLYPQVDKIAGANVSLLCTSGHLMVIAFNPGKYIVEQITSEYNWSFAQTATGNFSTFRDLTAGTAYRFRLYRLTKEGISQPEVSDWFSTFDAHYVPQPVRSISFVRVNPEETIDSTLDAVFEVEAAEDRCCSYNMQNWNGEGHMLYYTLEKFVSKTRMFYIDIHGLELEKSYTFIIAARNNEKVSPARNVTFPTPTCIERYSGNLSICAPEAVTGLRAQHVHVHKRFYDIQVSWDEPTYEPDNYTIEIDFSPDENGSVSQYIPGNRTEASFTNLEVTSRYTVYISAYSKGGEGPRIETTKTVIPGTTTNKFYRELIIGITTFITVLMLIGMIYLQYCKRKTKHFSLERFEGLRQKDLPIEVTMKLLHKEYESKLGNNPLRLDKFEIRPQMLKLGGVLGSGAYGIVRLCSLQDEFGNVKDVAVKMLKDNPSAEDMQNFHKEILIMNFAGQHPNIVSLIGCCTLHNMPVLVVEYCSKGDLQTYLKTIWQYMVSVPFNHRARSKFDADSFTDSGIEYLSNASGGNEQNYQNIHIIANRLYDIQQDLAQHKEAVTGTDLLNFARQIATGMEFLSSNRIIHRDLAARNVLVCADRIVKISDFGLSRDIYQENLYRKQGNGKLPLKWMAIEALTHQIYTTYSDVWSFGILLWEIVTMGALPYPGIPTNAILKLLKSGYRMERPPSCGVELYNIMYSCWHVRPQERPTFTELKESLDKLLSCESDTKYLNMDEILCDEQNYNRVFDE